MIYQNVVNTLFWLGAAFAEAIFGGSITEIRIYGIIFNVVVIFGCLVVSRLSMATTIIFLMVGLAVLLHKPYPADEMK